MPDAQIPERPTAVAGHDDPLTRRPPELVSSLPPAWLMALALVAVAANLRVAITSVPPLLDTLSADLGLSHAAAGALTTLPVLCMGLFAPVASRIAHRLGAVAAVLAAAVAVVVGTASRFSGENVVVLYVGTFLAGVGIAVAGTLLPRLVKTFFSPQRIGLVTGLTMLAMMGGAAVSSAASVPLANLLGSWQASLGSWAVPALLGALLWLPFTRRVNAHSFPTEPPARDATGAVTAGRRPTRRADRPAHPPTHRLPWRHPTAWLLAAYLALQSWAFYSSVTWLAPTYVEHGWSLAQAGYLGAVFAAAQIVTGLLGPMASDRVHDLRRLLLPCAVISTTGTVGVWLAPDAMPWVWAAVIGLGQGAAFSLGLVMLVRYATTPEASGRLTGMTFLVSYGIASVGPLAMGVLRDVTGTLAPVWGVLTALGIAQGIVVLRLRPDLRRVP